ncbi:MAG: hypothetical protein GX962_14195 [Epulopiscium sp.]|nr:hypothetical protein [Candidatus Epulonipiscium sp.]
MFKDNYIEHTIAKKYPHININDYIWQGLITVNYEYGSGWHDVIIELVMQIEDIYKKNNVDITDFKINQIKEKYGTLRFYAISSLGEVHDLISEYEDKSKELCCECGEIGSLHEKHGWSQTLCDKCAIRLEYKRW